MVSKPKFVVRPYGEKVPTNERPIFVLTTDNWDDYGSEVQFHLSYIHTNEATTKIGPIKILRAQGGTAESQNVQRKTQLPQKPFVELGTEFISLGQEEAYYTTLRKKFADEAEDVLTALRDIAWSPALAAPFEPSTQFRNALLRFNGAERARRFGRAWALGQEVNESFSFTYSCSIEEADAPFDVHINFNGRDAIPGRIVGLIGRNAVGKTRFLADLGHDLAQISRTSAQRLKKRNERFPGRRPLFNRVIAISYSAFDRFARPAPTQTSSYVYCGIRNDKGGLSRQFLLDAYRKNQDRIRLLGRQEEWVRHMKSILGDMSEELTAALGKEIAKSSQDDSTLSLLSSGQAILSHFVTALLSWIQPNSLVLFDEPETHLHPNAVASLFLVLTEILSEYDSYAAVATHSPVVIQEIPAKRVAVLTRTGNLTEAHELEFESFGESVSELTKHVFETVEVDSVYRTTLKELAEREPAKKVLKRFPAGLSLNAQAYLLAQYGRRRK